MYDSHRQEIELADRLFRMGRHDDAESVCSNILAVMPGHLEALYIMGASAAARNSWETAIDCYRKACSLFPDISLLFGNLGSALMQTGQFAESRKALENAVRLDRDYATAYYNLGVLAQLQKSFAEAEHFFEKTLSIDPVYINAWINLAVVKIENGDMAGAIHCCKHGLYRNPDNSRLLCNLATAYARVFRYDDALETFERLLDILPENDEYAELLGQKANILSDMGMIDESIALFERASKISPDLHQRRELASTRLFVLHYSSKWSPEAIFHEHFNWGKQYYSDPVGKRFENTPDPCRRLRIAYISPDFRIHAVVFFLQPVLAAHDHQSMEVYCYSDVAKPDDVTRQLKEQHGAVWRDISGLDNAAVERMIIEDRIDILIELAGHTSNNRLELCSSRVAPLQVSWIGYPDTTGVPAIDYRISDYTADPPGLTEHLHTEKLVRLPVTFSCYRPGADFPPVSPSPAAANGCITFGTFCNFKKVTGEFLDLWGRILANVPDSRFVFRAIGLTEERFLREILPFFTRHGITRERVTLLGHVRSVVEQVKDYSLLDIALDTYPYCGTTTTCEALYMGLPVVSMAGKSHVSRVGASFLKAVGLEHLVSESPDGYMEIACRLASDTQQLALLRTSLRDRLMSSPLTDNVTFTRNLENIYREIWRKWCLVQTHHVQL